jgi:hypothetical protein
LCFADVSYLSNGYLDTNVDWVPGVKGLRLKHFPFIETTDPDDIIFNFLVGARLLKQQIQMIL